MKIITDKTYEDSNLLIEELLNSINNIVYSCNFDEEIIYDCRASCVEYLDKFMLDNSINLQDVKIKGTIKQKYIKEKLTTICSRLSSRVNSIDEYQPLEYYDNIIKYIESVSDDYELNLRSYL